MGVYQKLHINAEPSDLDIAAFDNTLGGRVMKAATQNTWTAQNNMTEILDAFYNALVHFHWEWRPRTPCGNSTEAAKTLDGQIKHAECYVPANALYQLLIAKAPYGFAVDKANVKVAPFSGHKHIIGGDPKDGPTLNDSWKRDQQNEINFISSHPRAGVHGLAANIYDVSTNQIADMYAWCDHKVVSYLGKFWDPCYNKVYLVKEGMTKALVIGINIDGSPTASPMDALTRVWEAKVLVPKFHQAVYFRSVPFGQARGGSEDMKVEGPYATSICGDEDAYGDLRAMTRW